MDLHQRMEAFRTAFAELEKSYGVTLQPHLLARQMNNQVVQIEAAGLEIVELKGWQPTNINDNGRGDVVLDHIPDSST